MAKHVLAGDIGGTKTILALYALDGAGLKQVRETTYASQEHRGLEKLVEGFLSGGREKVHAAAFGIAGPVVGARVKTTNLPWLVRAAAIEKATGGARVRLLNDLEATALGGLFAPKSAVHWLVRGTRRAANVAVIAAGTGLGQAFLYWDGTRHRPVATEGGHVDFAPRNDRELALFVYLQRKLGRVSYERVLSGPGLVNIFSFLDEEVGRPVSAEVRERLRTDDPARVIGESGLGGTCVACSEALDVFVSVYGAQAGNLALTVMATGGVLVGGGIAAKLLPRLRGGDFVAAFLDKGRYREFLSAIPIGILLDPKTALHGAAHAAAELAR
jgi:glucokinase